MLVTGCTSSSSPTAPASPESLLGDGQARVGTTGRIDHVTATPLGGSVQVSAGLVSPAGARRLTFAVTATDHDGESVGGCEITRVAYRCESVAAQTGTTSRR